MPGAESSSEKVASGSGGGSAANGPSSSTTTPSHMQSQGTGGGGSGGAGGAGAANAEYRVVVFGAAGVGKTSLVLRFVRGTFRETYVPTIEDTYRQVISCNKQVCTLQITDTTGTHQFPAMQRLSMSKGHAFLLVYSIASRQSLEELRPIVTELVSVRGGQAALAEVPLMLVGNKCDENNNREVSVAEGQQHAKKWGCAFMETSAKTNLNVKEMFQELLQLEKRRNVSLAPAAGLDGKEGKKRKGGAATGDQPDGTKSGGGCLVM